MDEILTVDDIQKHLKIGRDKAYALVKLKGFPSFQIGNTFHTPKKDYEKWISNQVKHNTRIIV